MCVCVYAVFTAYLSFKLTSILHYSERTVYFLSSHVQMYMNTLQIVFWYVSLEKPLVFESPADFHMKHISKYGLLVFQNSKPAVLVTNQHMNWRSHSAKTSGWHSILNLPDAFVWTRDTASLMNKSLLFPLFLNTTQAV